MKEKEGLERGKHGYSMRKSNILDSLFKNSQWIVRNQEAYPDSLPS